MARKAAPKSKPPPDPRDTVIDGALALAAREGWSRVSLADIAEEAGLSLDELRALFPSRNAILAGYAARIDRTVLSDRDPEMAGRPAPERLFDVLMRRFDALNEHKEAVRAILRSGAPDPAALVCGRLALHRSMGWMLEAAGLGSAGLRGRFRAEALAALYLSVLPVWLRDDSPDMASTMAALDRRLRRLDRTLSMLCRMAPGSGRAGGATAEAAGDASSAGA